MNKLLKPYTIVPAELYVKRDADRQLFNIIQDMGRPGYVLVSRQMGKTNLLLNFKREQETPEDIFVYIDLSNPFSTAKDCFENIIDTILETNEEFLDKVAKEIYENRKIIENVPPHKQHEYELKKIIRAIKGKLVIILDEIDALTKTTYSDRIFSQIRSVYFARVNFPEFERLTYILSGVVEPSEIIKDSKISPFNIGQKIFLNDFSFNEFKDFVNKSNLHLNEDVLKSIYGWTNGNPRITWDVCSEVENIVSKEITVKDINDIIVNNYLISYDKPPVDNIRELIKGDSELRNAIIEIEYNKGSEVSDRVKNKLYLAGIINYTHGDVKIKNEVIRKAINLDWINSIEKEEKGVLIVAVEHYNKGNYLDCLSRFEEYLKNDKFPSSTSSRYYFYMGESAFYLLNYDLALKYLELAKFDIEDDALFYYSNQNLKGLTYLYLKKYELSLECFNSVLKRNKKDNIFATAIMNIGYICLQSDNILSISEAKRIFLDIVDEKNIDSDKIDARQLSEFKTISYYNLAKLYEKESNLEQAVSQYYDALNESSESYKPRIIIDLLSSTEVLNNRTELINELIKLIKLLIPCKLDYESRFKYSLNELKEALLVIYSERKEQFLKLSKELFNNFDYSNFGSFLYDIAFISLNKTNSADTFVCILHEMYDNKNNLEFEISDENYYNTLKLLAYFQIKSSNIVQEYLSSFCTNRIGEIDFIDIEIFINYINWLYEKKDYKEALNIINIIKSVKKDVSEQYQINYLIVYNFELRIYFNQRNKTQSKAIANNIISLANNAKISVQKSRLLGDKELSIIRENAENILKLEDEKHESTKNRNRYGRNEIVRVKYRNGSVVESKYKKVEKDIENKLCMILK